jgi:hypothetical protein
MKSWDIARYINNIHCTYCTYCTYDQFSSSAFFSTKFIWIFYNLFFFLLLFSHHRFSFSQWNVFHFHNDILFEIEEKSNLIAKTIMFASKLSKYENVIYIMLKEFSKKFNDKCNAARKKHNLIIIRRFFVVKETISLLRE